MKLLKQKKKEKILIAVAREFAEVAHEGQKDDEGKDYFRAHLVPVAKVLMQITDDVDIIRAAYLHDVIEDTDTNESLLRGVFGDRVTDLVMEVTHEGKKDEYGYYFPRLQSKEAIMIKLADRLSNISRMTNWSEERQEHYLKKTKFWKDGSDIKGSTKT